MLLRQFILGLCLVGHLFSSCCTDDEDEIPTCTACSLAPEVGICNAAIPKFYFDSVTQQCTQFIWGGCGGVVPFQTLEECEACGCHQ